MGFPKSLAILGLVLLAASHEGLASDIAPAASAAQAQLPPGFEAVLKKHGLDQNKLARRGYAFRGELCYAPDKTALGPRELDERLSASAAAERRLNDTLLVRHLDPKDTDVKAKLDAIFKESRTKLETPIPIPEHPMPPPSKRSWVEPDFDPAMKGIALKLWHAKNAAPAVKELSARFTAGEGGAGLSDTAPEALRLLALAVYDGKGGKAARLELDRELALAATLKAEQKRAFAKALRSPLAVYVSLGSSRSPHLAEAQLYFSRMRELLRPTGQSVTDYIKEADPHEAYASFFVLRLNAYDALIPYLNRNPSEAGAIVAFLFTEKYPSIVRSQAGRIEGLALQLSAYGRPAVRDAFAAALIERAHSKNEALARKAALFLKLNEKIWPKRLEAQIREVSNILPEGLLDDPSLNPKTPYDAWPEESWTFVLYFSSRTSYEGWLAHFQKRGYKLGEKDEEGVTLSKKIKDIEVRLVGKVIEGDEEGFLKGAAAKDFREGVSRDLRDPDVRGVILRTHAQFSSVGLFARGVSKHKLWWDGSCRGAWTLPELRRLCPSCVLIANTATGAGGITNRSLHTILEELAAKSDWDEIGDKLIEAQPKDSSRLIGPWTPSYPQALRLLERALSKKQAQ